MERLTSTPTFTVGGIAHLLEESLVTLEWGLTLIPAQLVYIASPGRWSVAMNLAHMAIYEEMLATPVLTDLALGADGTAAVPSGNEDWFFRESEALSREPLTVILERLRRARRLQVELVRGFSEAEFNAPATGLWAGPLHGSLQHSPGWVAAKTAQHTWEHGNSVLQAGLFTHLLYPR